MRLLSRTLVELEERGELHEETRARLRSLGFDLETRWRVEPIEDGRYDRRYVRALVRVSLGGMSSENSSKPSPRD